MQKSIKKIAFLIFIILILPITIFFIYQFASLNKSEEELNKIYVQQLETIIFSINQYSEDIISSWTNEINPSLGKKNSVEIDKLIEEDQSISFIFIADLNLSSFDFINPLSNNFRKSEEAIKSIVRKKSQVVQKLLGYLNIGYQKREALGKVLENNQYLILYAFKNELKEKNFCGIVFNAKEFIKRNLVSKISQASGEEFTLAVINRNDQSIVHSSDKVKQNELTLKKPLWLIPGFDLGIKMKNRNIEDLLHERYVENLMMLAVLFLLLVSGIILIYYNVRKELRLTQLKSDFVSNVSHELRTPLSLISLYSETLVLDRLKSEEKKKEYYSVINSETNRLSKIVNSILNFSKMESGTRKYNLSDVNLVEMNKEILGTYDFHIKSKGFSYSINTKTKLAIIKADQDAIAESIINLIENAMKYSAEKKEFIINIGNNKIGPYWEIVDSGIGISEEDKIKIFEKFYRVSSGLVHNTKGTGLGLSLVKQIMDAHNGEITVKSSLEKGSTFRLQFNNISTTN